MALIGLEGISKKEIPHVFIQKVSDIRKAIEAGSGATTADDNGAIIIWRDDAGLFRCKAERYRKTIESRCYKKLSSAENWYMKWVELIK